MRCLPTAAFWRHPAKRLEAFWGQLRSIYKLQLLLSSVESATWQIACEIAGGSGAMRNLYSSHRAKRCQGKFLERAKYCNPYSQFGFEYGAGNESLCSSFSHMYCCIKSCCCSSAHHIQQNLPSQVVQQWS